MAGEEQRSHFDAFKGDKKFLSGFFDWHVNDQLTLELDLEHQRLNKLSTRTPSLWWWGWNVDAAAVAVARAAFPKLGPKTYAYQSRAKEPNEQTYVATRAHYQLNDDWKAPLPAQDRRLIRSNRIERSPLRAGFSFSESALKHHENRGKSQAHFLHIFCTSI